MVRAFLLRGLRDPLAVVDRQLRVYRSPVAYTLFIKRYGESYLDWIASLNTAPISTMQLNLDQGLTEMTKLDERKGGLSTVIAIQLNSKMLESHFTRQNALEGGSIHVASADGKTVVALGDNIDYHYLYSSYSWRIISRSRL
ncbi:hypothetical protein AGMMS49992_19220 [Clostridia bacterium]|nr:hypothetical protein AGMMS49992_19220 [Clostridia bacterium]